MKPLLPALTLAGALVCVPAGLAGAQDDSCSRPQILTSWVDYDNEYTTTFALNPGCPATSFGLVALSLPKGVNPADHAAVWASKQTTLAVQTVALEPGKELVATLVLPDPPCGDPQAVQIDIVSLGIAAVLSPGQVAPDNLGGSIAHKYQWRQGPQCVTVAPASVPTTTTITAAPVTTEAPAAPAPAPKTEVLALSETRAEAPAAHLPATGVRSYTMGLVLIAAALLGVGSLSRGLAFLKIPNRRSKQQ